MDTELIIGISILCFVVLIIVRVVIEFIMLRKINKNIVLLSQNNTYKVEEETKPIETQVEVIEESAPVEPIVQEVGPIPPVEKEQMAEETKQKAAATRAKTKAAKEAKKKEKEAATKQKEIDAKQKAMEKIKAEIEGMQYANN